MKSKYRTLILGLGFLIIIMLGASVINDILFLIFKDSLNKFIFTLISSILIFLLITILFKTKPFKELPKKLYKFETKIKNKKR
jgi:hypothetical protein